jgi:hypothetical protein
MANKAQSPEVKAGIVGSFVLEPQNDAEFQAYLESYGITPR